MGKRVFTTSTREIIAVMSPKSIAMYCLTLWISSYLVNNRSENYPRYSASLCTVSSWVKYDIWSPLVTNMHTHTHTHTYIYIYIHIRYALTHMYSEYSPITHHIWLHRLHPIQPYNSIHNNQDNKMTTIMMIIMITIITVDNDDDVK